MDQDIKSLLNTAKHEIIELRHRNELLEAQMSVVRLFDRALNGPPVPHAFGVDVVWQIDRAITPTPRTVIAEEAVEPLN